MCFGALGLVAERIGDYALTQNGALVKPHHALFYSLWNTNVSGML
jgi:hypothetical protein